MTAEIATKICPRCRADIVPRPIVYGLPTYEAFLAADAGEFNLGGCLVGAESLDFACPKCGAALPWANPARESRWSERLIG